MNTETNSSTGDDCVTHFDDKAASWSSLYDRACFADRLGLFVSRAVANAEPGGHILDYGCGTGVLARKLNEAGFRVTGVDASKKMIDEACKPVASRPGPALTFSHINPADWPGTPEQYDAIVCSSVLEYIDDHGQMLRKLSSALKPGGKLIISVPNSSSLPGKLEDAVIRLSSKFRNRQTRDAVFCRRRYSASEFSKQLDGVGLDTNEVTYFEMPRLGRPGIPLSRNRWLGVMMIVTGTRRDATG